MGKVDDYINALAVLGDGRYHYWDGRPNGIGCSEYTRLALLRAGLIRSDETLHAASDNPGPLADPSRFQRLAWSPDNLQRGIIMWSAGYHVMTWAGDGRGSVYEAAPESTHSKAECGTGVGLHVGHGYYNCGTGTKTWTCLYKIIDKENVTQTAKEVLKMDKTYNIGVLAKYLPGIRSGSTGDIVKALQTIMARYGWYSDIVDGHAGPKTVAGIKLLQTALNVDSDGYFGPISWAALLG